MVLQATVLYISVRHYCTVSTSRSIVSVLLRELYQILEHMRCEISATRGLLYVTFRLF